MFEGITTGFTAAFTIANLSYLVAGCVAGTFIGMLPGLGPMTAIALMIPIAAALDPVSGIIMMAAVYYGAIFGGSTSAILINAPGVASTVATSFDGYPLASSGHAGKALTVAALASFAGGAIAALLLMIFAPLLSQVSLSFHSSDYFALMILGLAAVSAFAGPGKMIQSLAMSLLGLMLATVGTDQAQGLPRITFGLIDLVDGISFLLVVMATFAAGEALKMVFEPQTPVAQQEISRLSLSRAEAKASAPATVRASLMGFLIGLLPGAGATVASLLAYGSEQRFAGKHAWPRFGHGNLQGIAAPEAANNAAATGSFVPLLTLGIPGSGTTAILLGALIAYGIQPGPMLYVNEPAVFWGVIVSMWLGNLMLLFLNLPLIPYIARLLNVPRTYLLPIILFLSMLGIYVVSLNPVDIYLMLAFAIAALIFRLLDFPLAPMILAFILGGMIEENLHRALLIHDNSLTFLYQRPLTLGILLLAAAALIAPALARRFNNRNS